MGTLIFTRGFEQRCLGNGDHCLDPRAREQHGTSGVLGLFSHVEQGAQGKSWAEIGPSCASSF